MADGTLDDRVLSRTEVRAETGASATAAPRGDLDDGLDGLPALVSYWDSGMRNRVANGAFVEFFGLTPQEIGGRHVSEVLGPELYALNRPYIERVLAGEPQLFERIITDHSGAQRHTQVSYMPYVLDGTVGGFLVLVSEIGARRAGERARAAAEARFRDLVELAPDAIVLVNTGGEIVLVNARTERLFGYTREELLGMAVESLLADGIGHLHGDRREECFAAPSARPTGELTRGSALRKNGTKVVVEMSVGPLAGPEGTLACVWIRKVGVGGEMEQANERLAALVDSSDDAIIDKQLDGTIVGWNAAAERIYGYRAEEAIGRPISILVAPERTDELAVILQRIAAGESIDHYETVRVCKDGRRVEVSISVSPIKDQHGAIIGAATIARDVTDRKRAEDNIRMVLESTPDAIVVVADDGRIQIINRATEALFGYARDELLGQTVELLFPDGFTDAQRDLRQGSLSAPDIGSVGATTVVMALRKDGSEVLVEIVVGPLATPQGTLACASIRDVSVRGEMEKANQWLRAVVRSSDDAIVGTDLQGTIVSWNGGLSGSTGIAAKRRSGSRQRSWHRQTDLAIRRAF
jgi:PAS domain S-box-containing protein